MMISTKNKLYKKNTINYVKRMVHTETITTTSLEDTTQKTSDTINISSVNTSPVMPGSTTTDNSGSSPISPIIPPSPTVSTDTDTDITDTRRNLLPTLSYDTILDDLQKLKEKRERRLAELQNSNPNSTAVVDIPNFNSPSNSTVVLDTPITTEGLSTPLITPTRESLDQLDEVVSTMTKIKEGASVTAELIVDRLKKADIALEQSIAAQERQESLYIRAEEFVRSSGVGRMVSYTAFGLVTGYTIYYILRYQQIPLGGFIKSIFTGAASATGAQSLGSNTVSPVINVNIGQTTPPVDPIRLPGSTNTLLQADSFASTIESFCIKHPIVASGSGMLFYLLLKWKFKR